MKKSKPKVKLLGRDGNAFVILGSCTEAARKAKWSDEEIKEFIEEATSSDYDHLLQTAMKYFDVE